MPIWPIYIGLAAALFILSRYIPVDLSFPVFVQLTDGGAATISLIGEMAKLIVTLNTTMLAAAAALAIKGGSWSSRWSPFDSLLIVMTFLAGAVSYFGVYLGYMRVLNMVYHSTIYPLETGFKWGLRLQYYGVITGVFLLGLVFVRMLEGRRFNNKA